MFTCNEILNLSIESDIPAGNIHSDRYFAEQPERQHGEITVNG